MWKAGQNQGRTDLLAQAVRRDRRAMPSSRIGWHHMDSLVRVDPLEIEPLVHRVELVVQRRKLEPQGLQAPELSVVASSWKNVVAKLMP